MTDQPTNCITFNSPPTEEVLRLDKEGFHYKGQFIADAGEAHYLMVEFLKQNTRREPQGPTDEDLEDLADAMNVTGDSVPAMRRALELWSRPAIEPQGPTDGDLIELFNENDWNYISPETFLDIARSVLELR